MEVKTQTELEMEACANVLKMSKEEGLEVEVMVWAMKALRDNRGMQIIDALQIGFDEWVNK